MVLTDEAIGQLGRAVTDTLTKMRGCASKTANVLGTLVRGEIRHFGAGPASSTRLASNSVFIQGMIPAETPHARQAAQHGRAWR